MASVVGVLFLSGGGITLYQNQRDIEPSPLGWSDAQVTDVFKDGQLDTCDLGEDFYESVGIRNMRASENGCSGVLDTVEGVPLYVNFRLTSSANPGIFEPYTNHQDWEHTFDPESSLPASLDEIQYANTDGMRCTVVSSRKEFETAEITVHGPCDSLDPLITQLDNLAEQARFTKRGLFNFGQPHYKAVETESISAASELYRQAREIALQPGEAAIVPQGDFEDSPFAVTNVWLDGDYLHATTEFTLGEKLTSGRSTFSTPNLVALYPNGEQVGLVHPGAYSQYAGETVTRESVSQSQTYEPGEFVIVSIDSKDEPHVWAF